MAEILNTADLDEIAPYMVGRGINRQENARHMAEKLYAHTGQMFAQLHGQRLADFMAEDAYDFMEGHSQ